MNSLDSKMLVSLGINLDSAKQKKLVEYFQQTLDERVGLTIIDLLGDVKAKELIRLTETDDRTKLEKWLNENISDYNQIIEEEYIILLDELVSNSGRL